MLLHLQLLLCVVGQVQLRADLSCQVQFVLTDFVNDEIRSDNLEIIKLIFSSLIVPGSILSDLSLRRGLLVDICIVLNDSSV